MGLVISMRPVLPELDRRLPSQGHQDRKSILVVHISWSWELKEHMLLQKQMFYAPTDLLNYVRKFLFLFWLCCAASGIFVSWPGIEPWVTAVKSPNHWTARALPTKLFYGNMCGNELDLKKKPLIYLAALGLGCGMWDVVLWLGIKPRPSALAVQS